MEFPYGIVPCDLVIDFVRELFCDAGNLISDWQTIQAPAKQNVNFGLTQGNQYVCFRGRVQGDAPIPAVSTVSSSCCLFLCHFLTFATMCVFHNRCLTCAVLCHQVIGYLSEEDIRDGIALTAQEGKKPPERDSLVQLVSGVGWLVRNGKNYVKESFRLEGTATM